MYKNIEKTKPVRFKSQVTISQQELNDQYGTLGVKSFIDLVWKIPYSKISSRLPYVATDENWKSLNTDPTLGEIYKQRIYELNQKLSSLTEKPIYPPVSQWVDVKDLLLAHNGHQRLQLQDSQTLNTVIERADTFDLSKTGIELARLNNSDEKYNGRLFVIDGGGTCLAAVLRDIQQLPIAKIVECRSMEEIGQRFYDLDESRENIKGEEKFKHRLVCDDPLAVLQHGLMRQTHTTCMLNHTDRSYKNIRLTALKVMMQSKFGNTKDKTVSGDAYGDIENEATYKRRKCRNITDVINVIIDSWPGDSRIQPAVFKALVTFYASMSDVVTARHLTDMLKDYISGRMTGPLGTQLNATLNSSMCAEGRINWKTQDAFQKCLGLQDMTESHRMYGICIFGLLWNHWAKQNRSVDAIQEDWLKLHMKSKSKFYWYDSTVDYNGVHKKDVGDLI